ncbi:MAG TPA: YihY/virulence factor BrkB family protein [Acidobacteriaceae bacterium]|nr:YihY/virulence factor BrkB family protein [Acidobacteriaceae bacterium]
MSSFPSSAGPNPTQFSGSGPGITVQPASDSRRSVRLRRTKTFARWHQRLRRRWKEARLLSVIVFRELIRTKVFDVAAGVAFWFMMSMIPLLMMIVALITLLPIPSLLPQLLGVLAILVPPASLTMVEEMAGNLLTPHGGVLSFAIFGYVWSATGGFTSLISALNIAYDVKLERTWLRDRLQAILLTFTSGGLLSVSLLILIAGPHFGHLLSQIFSLPAAFEKMWPVIRIATVFVSFVLALEIVYFLGPKMRQRFRSTLPGAIFAIALWFAGSAGLSFYLNHIAHYSSLYGGMGAVIGLMLWVYLIALAILIGAELNAELAKRRDSLFRSHVQEGSPRRRGQQDKAMPNPSPDRTAA